MNLILEKGFDVCAVLTGCALMVWVNGAAAEARVSLAAGCPVVFSPRPKYSLTAKGDTDTTDLTDGRLSARKDKKMWFESQCVGFSYPGLVNLAVDLGAVKNVDEVVIRFQGGSPQAGVSVPGWIDVLASRDGVHYRRVGRYSKWDRGGRARFGVPRDTGKAWIHPFRFTNLRTSARFVGISFYGTGVAVCDELYVYPPTAGKPATAAPPAGRARWAPFSVTRPLPYFHKPVVSFSPDIPTPLPVGLIGGSGNSGKPLEFTIDLPEGMTLLAGGLGGVPVAEMKKSRVESGKDRWTRWTFPCGKLSPTKTWGRLYVGGDRPPDREGAIRFQVAWPDGASPVFTQPVRAIRIPSAPRPKRLITGLGWWSLDATRKWPHPVESMKHLGINTIPVFARWSQKPEDLEFLDHCRAVGLRIMNIDSPFHTMLSQHKGKTEMFAQFADGAVGTRVCPSYRGPFYREEIQRVAEQTARVGASILSCDIELWSWRGPTDCEKCTRCRADFAKSGCKDWAEWRLTKGEEIWKDLATAVQRATAEHATADPTCPKSVEIGGYDFRPGENYQFFWPFDRLYPKFVQNSQVSTYSALEPCHIGLIGDEARKDRKRLPKSDVLPWLTPGDAGTFPGDAFRYALLECYANGARGVHFWSGRVWDADSLAAFADAVRIVTPVEDIIVDGELLDSAAGSGDAGCRLSGMRRGDDMFVLVADYFTEHPETVTVRLPVHKASDITDLDTGERLATVTPEKYLLRIKLDANHRARALRVRLSP